MDKNEALGQIKVCPYCRNEVAYEQKFCGSCGKKIDKIKTNHIRIIIPTAAGLAFVGIIAAVVIGFLSPKNSFTRALKNDDYSYAFEIYANYVTDKNFITFANEEIGNFLDEQVIGYASGNQSLGDAKMRCESLSQITDVKDFELRLDKLEISKNSFNKGKEQETECNYAEAIANYSLVIPEDIQNFETANDCINNCTQAFCDKITFDVDACLEDNNFSKAKKIINNAISKNIGEVYLEAKLVEVESAEKTYKCSTALNEANSCDDVVEKFRALSSVSKSYFTDDFSSVYETIKSEAEASAINTLNRYAENSQYSEAIKYYNSLPIPLLSSDIKTTKNKIQDKYAEIIIADADKLADSGNYDEAIALIDNAIVISGAEKFTSKRAEYKEQSDLSFVKSMKGKAYVSYDKIEKSYMISSNFKNYYQDFKTQHIMPFIIVSDTTTIYALRFGFNASDWIFTKEIIVAADENKISFDVKYYDLKTEVVYGGGIYEIWSVIHSTYINTSSVRDLSPLINNLNGASDITIRFDGSDGKKDFTPSSSDIKKVIDFWRLYQILENNPSYVSLLQ